MIKPSKRFALSACALAASLLVAACGGSDGDSSPPDTAAPTLLIEDGNAGATATGAVTFIFTFNESVGDSFTVDDIVVTGGTAGALIKVNDRKYLLELTPAPNSTGTLSVSVAAGKFTDLAGNASASAGAATQAFNSVTVVVAPPGGGDRVLASFDETPALAFEGFNGAETSTLAAGPAGSGTTGLAAKIIRLGGEVWAGAKVNVGVIPVTAANNKISARVYSAVAGVPMVLKLENATDPNINTGDLQATPAVVVGWQTLTWTVPANKVAGAYSWVVMLPNLGTKASATPGETYYFDDIKLVSGQ